MTATRQAQFDDYPFVEVTLRVYRTRPLPAGQKIGRLFFKHADCGFEVEEAGAKAGSLYATIGGGHLEMHFAEHPGETWLLRSDSTWEAVREAARSLDREEAG